jgi:hypothetical protein
MNLAEFLLARIDEDEWWAHEASRRDETYVPDGIHWQWVFPDDDSVADLDPARDPYVGGNSDHGYTVSLCSVEQFPTMSVGPLPQFAISHAEEVPTVVAGHIARHDPARVLAECEAKRSVLALHRSGDAWCDYCSHSVVDDRCPTIRALAAVFRDHPDFDPAWSVT